VIVDGAGDAAQIAERVTQIRAQIKEFKFSEAGRNFNDKKNIILSDPNNPFKK
jgi:hypothetical protein